MSQIVEALRTIEARRRSAPPAPAPVPRPSRVFRFRLIERESEMELETAAPEAAVEEDHPSPACGEAIESESVRTADPCLPPDTSNSDDRLPCEGPIVTPPCEGPADAPADGGPIEGPPREEVAADAPAEEDVASDLDDLAGGSAGQPTPEWESAAQDVACDPEPCESPTEEPAPLDAASSVAAPTETTGEPSGYGQLASNLLARLPSDDPAIVLFTGPTGGVGTTATVAPVASVLAERIDGRVLAVDCNPYHPELADQFGVAIRRDLADVLSGAVRWQDAVRATSLDGLSVLPIASGRSALPVDPAALQPLLDILRRHFALVLLDAASLAHPEAARLAAACDGTCLVVRLGRTTRRQTEAAAALIERHGGRLLGCVVTGVPAA